MKLNVEINRLIMGTLNRSANVAILCHILMQCWDGADSYHDARLRNIKAVKKEKNEGNLTTQTLRSFRSGLRPP